ncbi:MAG TPA: hypothetical protein VJH22_04325 [Candidatus Nanoarchaeia archaeon]|nr:hypothetical protein [Candidatus Nanoarchaeia archaeon]
MSQAVYVRIHEDDLSFIRSFGKQRHLDQSKAIKALLEIAIKEERLAYAIKDYSEGRKTIQECARIAGLTYREFFDELCDQHLLGPSANEQEEMLDVVMKD